MHKTLLSNPVSLFDIYINKTGVVDVGDDRELQRLNIPFMTLVDSLMNCGSRSKNNV